MDFYIKYIGDPNYNATQLQNNGEIEQLITQIETILFTRKTEVLGTPEFGCNLEDLVYSLNQNEFNIKQEIQNQINSYCPLATKYRVGVDVKFFKGEVRDIAYIDIVIDSKYLVQINLR
jgi:phage baseplate assembly protein W